jgi:hypothetical protein
MDPGVEISIEYGELPEKEEDERRNRYPPDPSDLIPDEVKLTPEEQKELDDRPILVDYRIYSNAQFALRLSIAKKIWRYHRDSQTKDIKRILDMYPCWGFYRHSGFPVRITGVGLLGVLNANKSRFRGQEWSAYATECAENTTEPKHQLIPTKALRRVEKWTADDLRKIKLNTHSGAFVDPLGSVLFEFYATHKVNDAVVIKQ